MEFTAWAISVVVALTMGHCSTLMGGLGVDGLYIIAAIPIQIVANSPIVNPPIAPCGRWLYNVHVL